MHHHNHNFHSAQSAPHSKHITCRKPHLGFDGKAALKCETIGAVEQRHVNTSPICTIVMTHPIARRHKFLLPDKKIQDSPVLHLSQPQKHGHLQRGDNACYGLQFCTQTLFTPLPVGKREHIFIGRERVIFNVHQILDIIESNNMWRLCADNPHMQQYQKCD